MKQQQPSGERPQKKIGEYMATAFTFPSLAEDIFSPFREDFPRYAREVLGVTPWSMQDEVLKLCSTRPSADSDWHGMLAVGAGVNTGKSMCGGLLINACFDCWGPSCLVLTTAPTQRSVEDLLWREVRVRRGAADPKWGISSRDFIGPSAPEMKRADNWWAKGFVATKQEAFKGRHEGNVVLIFDEGPGIPGHYFRAGKTMFKPDTWGHLWVVWYNPTDKTCQLYDEISRPDSLWKVIELSSLVHPNIVAELAGQPPPIPNAVSLSQFEEGIKEDCDAVHPDDIDETAFEWPPESNLWFKPGGFFEANFLGRWPSDDEADLWSDALWQRITEPLTWDQVRVPAGELPRVGCDVARKGFNKTAIAVALGDYCVGFEEKQGQNTMATVGRIVELCAFWAEKVNPARRAARLPDLTPQQIPNKIDDQGVGGAVTDRLRELGYLVYPITAQSVPNRPDRYPDKRSELWYDTRRRAREGKLHLGLLPRRVLDQLRRQAKAPRCEVMSTGQRQVERKEAMMARLEGQSPDGMDALNLAFYSIDFRTAQVVPVETVPIHHRFEGARRTERDETAEHRPFGGMGRPRPRRRLFGQGG